ncbi:MAG: hypothetical protein NW220_20910 [Leptolyngbyaceae cyanobacterium bins.349]|nr:hypothetical protein [Leptolyngbyaceae cyanobacterium bins.349]
MNTVNHDIQTQSDRTQAIPIATYIDEQSLNHAGTNPRKPWLTVDQLYIWGFRIFCGLCLGFLLFVAAIYYQIINP